MTFLAPWVLAVAGVAAAGTVLLHLIALARPPAAPLPTARFVPDTSARAASRTSRPTDRLLLLLRVLAILLLGAAFARPVRTPERVAVRDVILLDRSRAADAGVAADSALAWLDEGDVVVLFDSSATVMPSGSPDSLRASIRALEATGAAPRLSAALVAASRLAATLRDSTDSVRLVLVSPVAAEALDAATSALRERWPAGIEVVRTAPAPAAGARGPVRVVAPADDPVLVSAALAGATSAARVRIVREEAGAADSAWAADSGGVLVVWPDAVPAGWIALDEPDTLGAVVVEGATRARDVTLVAPFVRLAAAPEGERAVARWVDGAPAAVERELGAGCLRTVGVALGEAGDLALRERFGRFVEASGAPCGGERDLSPASDEALAMLRGDGESARALGPPTSPGSSLAVWPLLLGTALLVGELLVRRGGAGEGA